MLSVAVCGPFHVQVPVHSRREGLERSQDDGKGAKGRGRGGQSKGKGRGKGFKEPVKSDKGLQKRIQRYARGVVALKDITSKKDKKLAGQMKQRYRADQETAFRLAKAEVLQTAEAGFIEAEEGEKTMRLTQDDIIESASVGVARKRFSFDLPYGPYCCSMTGNGQNMLVGGIKGHVAFMHLESMNIFTELHVKETIRAVQTLHNENMFAVAQRKYIFIYDKQGIELHCIKQQKSPMHLDFLPYHFLLVSAGERGEVTWRDISYGQQVAEHKTKLGPTTCMRHNPTNAVMHLGHNKGVVTLWTPTVKEPVVKMACHNAKVNAIAVAGNYMVTAGAESKWKVWDLRMYAELHCYRTRGHAVNSIDVSMTGLVATGAGCRFEVWKDAASARQPRPYITEEYKGRMIECVRFRPFEDVCCVGHSDGFGSLIVPGAGKANFDSFEANPYETKSQRREREVNSLLDKLQPDSIMLNPDRIGELNQGVVKAWKEESAKKEAAEAAEAGKSKKEAKKARGKNKVGNRMKRKALKQVAEQRQKARDRTQNAEGGSGGETDEEDDDSEGEAEDGGGAPAFVSGLSSVVPAGHPGLAQQLFRSLKVIKPLLPPGQLWT
ncbi:utp7 [Symbiodinium sp. CCMP2592]|nr:utp7 [Symbiodinium sp. CCMP2592]